MDKLEKKMLRPDTRKFSVFLLIVSFILGLWINIFINSLPAMIAGTQDYYSTFCDYKLSVCQNQNPQALDQKISYLNYRFSSLAVLTTQMRLADTIIPSSSFSCFLDKNTVDVITTTGDSRQNLNVLGITPYCNPASVLILIINLAIIYFFSCFLVEYFTKNKKKRR